MRSVLIIDDDLGFAESLAGVLSPYGYAADVVNTSERAVAALRPPRDGLAAPAVALIELQLGGNVSGIDLIPRLRALQPELVCVVMSADLDSGSALAALRRGAYDHFDKNSDPAMLLPVLDRCFDRIGLQRQHQAAYESLRIAKEKAEATSRVKSGFLATMSHELRTPLNAIIGFADMMRYEVLGALGNEQYRSYAADIHDSGTHLLQIINDFLDLSKAEAGKLDLNEGVFDLRDMIHSTNQLMSDRIRGAGLTQKIELPPELPLLRADELKTKQVLLNLLANAIKFTPPGGTVELSCRVDPESGLAITIADTGIGIAPEHLNRVLEAFEQIDSTWNRQQQGTGLGLALVKAIMELHGGTLELRSTARVGTEATITFPADRLVFDSLRSAA